MEGSICFHVEKYSLVKEYPSEMSVPLECVSVDLPLPSVEVALAPSFTEYAQGLEVQTLGWVDAAKYQSSYMLTGAGFADMGGFRFASPFGGACTLLSAAERIQAFPGESV